MRMRLRPESLGLAYSESIDRRPAFLAGGVQTDPPARPLELENEAPEPPTYYNTDVESQLKRFRATRIRKRPNENITAG